MVPYGTGEDARAAFRRRGFTDPAQLSGPPGH